MNLARARRRWRRWDRYMTYLDKLDTGTVCPPGAYRAFERLLGHRELKRERQARRDAAVVVGAVVEAYQTRTGGRP